MKIGRFIIRLLKDRNIAAVDLNNKVVYLKRGEKETAVRYASYGYRVHTIGEIHFAGKYIMPRGCSPADAEDDNTVTTALHCISDVHLRPQGKVDLLVIADSLPEMAVVEAKLKSYTPVKRCNVLCRMLLFFRRLPEGYVNCREIAWLEAPINLRGLKPLPKLTTVGILTALNAYGDYMLFSPLPGKEGMIRTGIRVAYISFDYHKNRIVYTEAIVGGYAFTNIDGYIFYLPYAYEPGRVIVKPGYSGSAVKVIDINRSAGISDGQEERPDRGVLGEREDAQHQTPCHNGALR